MESVAGQWLLGLRAVAGWGRGVGWCRGRGAVMGPAGVGARAGVIRVGGDVMRLQRGVGLERLVGKGAGVGGRHRGCGEQVRCAQ